MNKSLKLLLLFWLVGSLGQAQNKYEREHRIKKTDFPETAIRFLNEQVEDARSIRYYREIDSSAESYTAKFKKDRLQYYLTFTKDGALTGIGLKVTKVDIPSETYDRMQTLLMQRFDRTKIRHIQQQYLVKNGLKLETTIKNAFQNLLLPDNRYTLLLAAKKGKTKNTYEAHFDAEGNLLKIRQALPVNYDHILY